MRGFNRFYTNVAGWLNRHLHDTPFSLPEARVLYELHHHPACTASELLELVKMDKGYMSRILALLQRRGLLTKKRSTSDGRSVHLSLTKKGSAQFRLIDQASSSQIGSMLGRLTSREIRELLNHMSRLKTILEKVSVDEKEFNT